jgi:hypothetical protein
VFLASCKCNSTVNWIIRTDCQVPVGPPKNVRFISTTFADYVANVSKRLNINFRPNGNYKICDIRPAYGDLYSDDVAAYDYYGFGDLDVIYGDIRKFYTDDVLSFDVVSAHQHMISGHLVLFKNTEPIRRAYLKIPDWKAYLENPDSTRFDEDVYSDLFIRRNRTNEFDAVFRHNVYFKEQYSTVFHPMPWHDGMTHHPDVWFWKDGIVSNNRNIGHQYLYLHLMNFQSLRWANPDCRNKNIPWKDNPNMLFTQAGEEADGVRIDWTGIQRLI